MDTQAIQRRPLASTQPSPTATTPRGLATPGEQQLGALQRRANASPRVAALTQLRANLHRSAAGQPVVQRLQNPSGPSLFDDLNKVQTIDPDLTDWEKIGRLHGRLSAGTASEFAIGNEDATGLDALATQILAAYPPANSVYVSVGASADLVTTYMRRVDPGVVVRWLPISSVGAEHQALLEYTDPDVKKDSQRAFKRKKFERLAAYVDKALRLQGTDKDIILLDATDTGATQLLLKGLIEYNYPGLNVRPVSLSRSGHGGLGGQRFNDTSIELINPTVQSRHFMARIHQKFFKTVLGRAFDKADIDDILNNVVTSPTLREHDTKSIQSFAAVSQYLHAQGTMSTANRDEIDKSLMLHDL